jgi:hypothetical protein
MILELFIFKCRYLVFMRNHDIVQLKMFFVFVNEIIYFLYVLQNILEYKQSIFLNRKCLLFISMFVFSTTYNIFQRLLHFIVSCVVGNIHNQMS